MKRRGLAAIAVLLAVSFVGCASTMPTNQLQYAKLPGTRTYENDFPTVWKAVEETFREYKIVDRDPAKVGEIEMKSLHKRRLETDWIFSQSRDKYVEAKVNGLPKRIPLQSRIKYEVTAETQLGGTQVKVVSEEQVEQLHEDGTSAGYDNVDNPDPSRANEMLEKVGLAILSAHP